MQLCEGITVPLDALTARINEFMGPIRQAREQGAYLFQRIITSSSEAVIHHDGRGYSNFISNNYLGLSTHPAVKEAARQALDTFGTGMCGSPLACGTTELHRKLELHIAKIFGMEGATLFAAGYQALLGTISGILDPGDLALVDDMAHRSIIDGVKLSGAKIRAFVHNDTADLEDRLRILRKKHEVVIILVDSVYSMEGDLAPLAELHRIAKEYDAVLLLDEAHSLGMIGPHGYGLMDHFDLPGSAHLVSGTFSKFAGASGGYTAGPADWIDQIRHRSSPFIFSASAPPATIAGVFKAFDLIDAEPERREQLRENRDFFHGSLLETGLDVGGTTHVVPLNLGELSQAMTVNRLIFDGGILASPIMPPLVPIKRSGIRFGMMATHTREQVENAVETVIRSCRAAGVI